MGSTQSKISVKRLPEDGTGPGVMSKVRADHQAIQNTAANANHLHGSGTIINKTNTTNYLFNADLAARSEDHLMLAKQLHEKVSPPSNVSPSFGIPPRTVVFHGRDDFVNEAVRLLTQPGPARLAIVGACGMGKTTIALELLYDIRVVQILGDCRVFVSCEALFDADALVLRLAEACGVPSNTSQLRNAVVAKLSNGPPTILVLDNLETVWIVRDDAVVNAIEELLGMLAQIPILSLVITCRGRALPPTVKWSNTSSAVLEPFSLEAALRTFQDRAGRSLTKDEHLDAERLLRAVDMMPLAVTLLGHLAQRGTKLSDLVDRWTRTHNAVLRTHIKSRHHNIDASIKVSIDLLSKQVSTGEPQQLLSLCSMLPDGLHRPVFDRLREYFDDIDDARQALLDYALVSVGVHGELKVLNPIRHFVLEHRPAKLEHREAMYSIFFDIANTLPTEMGEQFKALSVAAAPEIGNLSSLLLAQICPPSQSLAHISPPSQILVETVMRFTTFASWQQPTVTLASALLPHLQCNQQWKARCLQVIGRTQHVRGNYRESIESLVAAEQLYQKIGDRSSVAWCKRLSGATHRLLGNFESAEKLLTEACAVYVKLRDKSGEARCRCDLGRVLQGRGNYQAAIEPLRAAHKTFKSIGDGFAAAQCSEVLGVVYRDQGKLIAAIGALDTSRSEFGAIGQSFHVAQCARLLGDVRRRQQEFEEAEKCLREAESLCKTAGDTPGLAECYRGFGRLRADQGRNQEAIDDYKLGLRLYEMLGLDMYVLECREQLQMLESAIKGCSVHSNL